MRKALELDRRKCGLSHEKRQTEKREKKREWSHTRSSFSSARSGSCTLPDLTSAEAPSELKTQTKLVPGTAAYLEEEGVAESNRQVRKAGPFPDVPLTVIAATDHGPYFREWEPTLMRLQQQLAALSPQGSLIVAQGSGHDVQLERPKTVVEVVRRMAAAVQAKR
jgi:pimeloyl-ACP methyl ester carboxylesterase